LSSLAQARETEPVETARSLRERSLEELLWKVLSERREGLVALRDRDDLRHGVWVQTGFVVGVHVAGRFDPLLDVLRRDGSLSATGYRACVEALWRSGARAGALAIEIGGASRATVRDALKAQVRERFAALLTIAETRGHDARFEPCQVPAAEQSVRMPLGSLLRSLQAQADGGPPESGAARDQARRRLRELARALHPDRHGHLDVAARQRLEREMAAATAKYHGFA
jgi:hypothetical protein